MGTDDYRQYKFGSALYHRALWEHFYDRPWEVFRRSGVSLYRKKYGSMTAVEYGESILYRATRDRAVYSGDIIRLLERIGQKYANTYHYWNWLDHFKTTQFGFVRNGVGVEIEDTMLSKHPRSLIYKLAAGGDPCILKKTAFIGWEPNYRELQQAMQHGWSNEKRMEHSIAIHMDMAKQGARDYFKRNGIDPSTIPDDVLKARQALLATKRLLKKERKK